MITGDSLIGGMAVKGTGAPFSAFDPTLGALIAPEFSTAGAAEIARACGLARDAFDLYRETTLVQRALFLESIADNILAIGDTLIERAMAESGLPRARLEGERGRTVNQLKLFASVVREGAFLDARLDSALPERSPPRPDLRFRMIALGPVAVFGASNFPLAFSVAGGDTASALAAGCPVVVKGHPAHPGTSELVGRAIQLAVAQAGLPAGVFALLTGIGNELGSQLVAHPAIQAVGFTGSRRAGLALLQIAAARPQPIPVYAEMSSVNPVFLLPHALAARAEALAAGVVGSLTMGVGQFCTSPGLVLGVRGAAFERFKDAAAAALTAQPAGTMLTAGIQQSFETGVHALAGQAGVTQLARGQAGAGCQGQATLLQSSFAAVRDNPVLSEEVFGPVALLIECEDVEQLHQFAEALDGHLTATLQMDEGDIERARTLLPVLERKVGRILVNGYPTGVEVADAMVHGGPFPATSDSRTTSVGTAAITRFLRPVCYQNLPQALLPAALQDANPLAIRRRRDGRFEP